MIKLDTNKHLSLALGHALSAIRIMNKSGNRITAEMIIDMPRDKWQQTLEYVEHIEAENKRLEALKTSVYELLNESLSKNDQYREALEAIKNHQETMNQGNGPLKDRKLYEFTAAWNIAQKALDGDKRVK